MLYVRKITAHTPKTLGNYFGCLSWISMTKERYQSETPIKKLLLYSYSYSYILFLRRPIWVHSWHFYHKLCN